MRCLETAAGRGLERAQNGFVLESWLEVTGLNLQRRTQTRDNLQEEKEKVREGILHVRRYEFI